MIDYQSTCFSPDQDANNTADEFQKNILGLIDLNVRDNFKKYYLGFHLLTQISWIITLPGCHMSTMVSKITSNLIVCSTGCLGSQKTALPHKGQWHGALVFSLIFTWINSWVNNEAGDLRCHHAHLDITVMSIGRKLNTWIIVRPKMGIHAKKASEDGNKTKKYTGSYFTVRKVSLVTSKKTSKPCVVGIHQQIPIDEINIFLMCHRNFTTWLPLNFNYGLSNLG